MPSTGGDPFKPEVFGALGKLEEGVVDQLAGNFRRNFLT